MQRSCRCPCSVRALEAFVRDAAGLDIHQRRNYISFRNLSNRSALQIRHNLSQSLASRSYTTIRSLDDTFVPFENVTSSTTAQYVTSETLQSPQTSDTLNSPEPFDPDEELGSTADFEPGISIHEEHAQTEPDSIVRDARIQQLDLKDRDQAIDAIFFPDLLAQPQLKPGERKSLGQRLNIFSDPKPTQSYPGKNARKKARRAAQAPEDQSHPEQKDEASLTPDVAPQTLPATPSKSVSKNKARADKKTKSVPLAPEDQATPSEQDIHGYETVDVASTTASTTTTKPISQARKDRKARRAAAQALEAQTATQGYPIQDEEAVDMASLLASATSPKPLSAAKASKIAQAIKTRKEEEKAAKKAAAEKIIADQQAAKLAQKERNRSLENWTVQKNALQEKFGEQNWNPRKRISPDALAGIRALHAKAPETFSTAVLAEHFKVPPEAIRRILKSKWQPSEEEAEERRERWEKRGEKKWTEMAELGIKPPKKWRERGVGKVGPGEVPPWRQPGKAGERWIESADADRFVVAGDQHADEMVEEHDEDDGIASRIL